MHDALDRHLDVVLERQDKALGPLWDAQGDMGKSIVGLATSALVLSMSVVHFLAKDGPRSFQWHGVLASAWILFTLAIVLGAIRQSWAGQTKSFRLHVEKVRDDIHSAVTAVEAGEDFGERIEDQIAEHLKPARDAFMRDINNYAAVTGIMFWSLALGLTALLAFTMKNFL